MFFPENVLFKSAFIKLILLCILIRMEAKIEAEKDLKEYTAQEHKRIRDQEKEGKKEKKEDKIKKKVGGGEGGVAEVPPEPTMTDRQREAAKLEEEKKEKDKQRREELKRAEFHDKEKELQERLFQSQNKVTGLPPNQTVGGGRVAIAFSFAFLQKLRDELIAC